MRTTNFFRDAQPVQTEITMFIKSLLAFLKIEPLPAVFIIALAALVVVGIALTKIP